MELEPYQLSQEDYVLNLKYWVDPYFISEWISLYSEKDRKDFSFLVSRLKDLYGDKRTVYQKDEDFRSYKQANGMPVTQYTITKLKKYHEVYPERNAEEDSHLLREYSQGLQFQLRQDVERARPKNYLEALKAAEESERIFLTIRGHLPGASDRQDHKRNQSKKSDEQINSTKGKKEKLPYKRDDKQHSKNYQKRTTSPKVESSKKPERKFWNQLNEDEKKQRIQQFKEAKDRKEYPYIECSRCK